VSTLKRARTVARTGGVRAIVRGGLRHLGQYAAALRARRELRRRLPRLATYEEAFAFAREFDHAGLRITPAQLEAEIVALMRLVEETQSARILEIGTHLGGTLFLLCRAAPAHAHLISLDLPLAGVPEGIGFVGYHESRRLLYRAFAKPGQRITLLTGNSQEPSTVARVERALGGEPLDLLFIDGSHRYEHVSRDFALYSPLVRQEGLVAFHDVWPGEFAGGAPRFWREIREEYEWHELVASPEQEAYGIGVLRLR
jgi:predicted O-methyltransferase YrrM